MDRISAPQQNRMLGGIADLLRKIERDSGPEFLPRGLDVMGLVRQLALPSAETVEKLSYGDPLFRMPTQSNIPITTDKGYLAEVLGMAPVVPAASRATTRISNEVADQLVKAITRNPEATAVRALDEIGRMSPVPQITTYHGSPYLFRQFDPMKKGTGEGAQAYGVGAGYTAESRPVAEGYRQAITKDKFLTQEGIFEPSSLEHLNVKATLRKDGLEKAIEVAKKSAVPDEDYPEVAAKAARDLEVLERLKESGGIQPIPGYLYKGEIPDEVLPKFLDWDKKFSEQTPEVKEAIKKYWDENKVYGDPSKLSGAGIYDSIVAHVYGDAGRSGAQQVASSELEKAGIRGIRYLDQGSRGASGIGTSNFIPFRPEDYRIQEINDRPIEEFFPGLLEPQAGAKTPEFKMPPFARVQPETSEDIDKIYDYLEERAKKAGYKIESGSSNVSGSRYLTIFEELPNDDVRSIELRVSNHGDRHPVSYADERLSIDPSVGGVDLEDALYQLQEKGYNLMKD